MSDRVAVAAPTVYLTIFVALALGACGGDDQAAVERPTLRTVRMALSSYGSGDAVGSLRRIVAWGDRALPHLEQIAMNPEGATESVHLVRVLRRMETKSSAELYVKVLAGKTAVPATHAVRELTPFVEAEPFVVHVRDNRTFKTALLVHANTPLAVQFVQACAAMQWTDTIPAIRRLLNNGTYRIRRAAAEALSLLTGTPVAAALGEAEFPARRLRKSLLSEPVLLPSRDAHDADFVAFTPWFGGDSAMLYGWRSRRGGFASELRVVASDMSAFDRWPLRENVFDVHLIKTNARELQAVVLAVGSGGRHPDRVIGLGADAASTWQYSASDAIYNSAVLWDSDGAYGMVLGTTGREGIVAVGPPHGAELWTVGTSGPRHGLRTSRHVPGILVRAGNDYQLFAHDRNGARELAHRTIPEFYVHDAIPCPCARGTAVLVAGIDHMIEAIRLVYVDDGGSERWEAILPSAVEKMTSLGRVGDGGSWLFVIATKDGQMFVVDEHGTLHWRGTLPQQSPSPSGTYSLRSGRIGAAGMYLAARLLNGVYVYAIAESALGSDGGK